MSKVLYSILDIVTVVTKIIFNASTGLLLKPARLSYKQYLLHTTLKAVRRCRVIGRSIDLDGTHADYKTFVQKHNLPYRTTKLGTAQILWLGSPDASHVIYCLHGGAYTHPAVSGHFLFMQRLVKLAAGSGKSVQIAFLKYTLAPAGQYPQQLREASAGLEYLLQTYTGDQITVIGDSAGGNLALALSMHLAKPHPAVTPVETTLASLILVSPWVSFKNDSKTWKTNLETDFMLDDFLAMSAAHYMGQSELDEYTQLDPGKAPVQKIGVTYGKLEVFADDVVRVGEQLKAAGNVVEMAGCEHEAHDQAVINAAVGWPSSESEKVVQRWVLEAL